jgi:hypothetical protein
LAIGQTRIDDMSFKGLTARAAAAMKPKSAENADLPAEEKETKSFGKKVPPKSKTS